MDCIISRCLYCALIFGYVKPVFNMKKAEITTQIKYTDPTKPVTLSCTTSSTRVYWFRGNMPLLSYIDGKVVKNPTADGFELLHEYGEERHLLIKIVRPTDAKNYTCKDGKQQTLRRYELFVNSQAVIHTYSKGLAKAEFSTVGLWCNVSGLPKPVVTWYVVDEDEDSNEDFVGVIGPYLEIRNITRGCNSRYRCKAENRLNSAPASMDISVTVLYKPEVDVSLDEPEENVVDFEFDNVTLIYNVQYNVTESTQKPVIKLTCHVSAYPNPTISWKVGEQVIGEQLPDRITKTAWSDSYLYEIKNIEGNLQLQITAEASEGDSIFANPYTCISENSVGKDHCGVQFRKHIG